MIQIATMGKFSGIPTKRASAKYGGGTSAGIQYIEKPHKFPSLKITKLKQDKDNINIYITDIQED